MKLNEIETSFFIIKPEAMPHRNSIKSMILASGFRIVSTKVIILPEFLLTEIYPSVSGELWSLTLQYMAKGESEMGLVEGEDAIKRLLVLGGLSTDPALCASDSIRGQYGFKEAIKIGKTHYYRNGFHRSHDKVEAERDVKLFASCLVSA
jgi:nucleoside diphosphate kinase